MILGKITYTYKWWKDEYLGDEVCFDTETSLIISPKIQPKCVITTAYSKGNIAYLIKNQDAKRFFQLHWSATLIAHNFFFDMCVIEDLTGLDFHEKIINGSIIDTLILYKLTHLAERGYTPPTSSLDNCIKAILKEDLPKNPRIRLTFGQFFKRDPEFLKFTEEIVRGKTEISHEILESSADRKCDEVKYKKMPREHKEYAALDPIATMIVYNFLKERIKQLPTKNNFGHTVHLMGDIALGKINRSGIKVDTEYSKKLYAEILTEMEQHALILETYGMVRGVPGFKKAYAKAIKHEGINVPLTEKTKQPSMRREDLLPFKGNPLIDAVLKFIALEKTKGFIKALQVPYIYPKYNSLINTGRTSCSSPNIQQFPRKKGIREALIPEKGNVFVDIDYDVAELCALGQICYEKFGYSKMRDLINEGNDLHSSFASDLYNKDIKKITKDERGFAKVPNFGFPANMSAHTFQSYAKGMSGLDISIEKAKELKAKWAAYFPEMLDYWKLGSKSNVHCKTGLVKNGCSYTSALNLPFQHRVAFGCKIALYNAVREGHDVKMFIHDQLVIEVKREKAEKANKNAQKIMVDSMRQAIPDVNISVDADIKERFRK